MNSVSANIPIMGLTDNAPRVGARDGASLPDSEQVAQDFESMFVSMLLKEMRQTLSDGLFQGDSSDAYGGLFDLYMGQHLAQTHALGIGELVSAHTFKQQDNNGQATHENSRSSSDVSGASRAGRSDASHGA